MSDIAGIDHLAAHESHRYILDLDDQNVQHKMFQTFFNRLRISR